MYSTNSNINDIIYLCELDNILKKEEWISIKDYPKYKISDLGRVKSFQLRNASILAPCISHDGYYYISLSNGVIKKFKIHRLVALHFIPNPQNKPQVNHKKGIKSDNRKVSLEWNTSFENITHAFKNGLCTIQKGEQRTNSKLTEKDVLTIRSSSLSCQSLADKYAVSIGLIYGVKQLKRWKHV